MKIYFFILCMLIGNQMFAKNKPIIIKLESNDTAKIQLPYTLSEVLFAEQSSDTIGYLSNKSDPTPLTAILQNRKKTFETYLSNSYSSEKKGSNIALRISRLNINPIEATKFSPTDTFHFECEFLRIQNGEKELLYTFKAKNLLGSYNQPELILSNYIKRALRSAIDQFSQTFLKNNHWNVLADTSTSLVQTSALLNQFNSNDSIACSKKRNIQYEDFNNNKVNDSTKSAGHARLILTYAAQSEEKEGKLYLTIHTKAFLDKTRSWINPKVNDPNFITYQQLHFDLCTYYGWKLNNAFRSTHFTYGEFKSELNQVYNTIYSEYTHQRKILQDETNSGQNLTKMNEWKSKTKNLMSQIDL